MIQYKLIANQIDIIDVAKRYGIDVANGRKALCPFHSEKTASLSFHRNRFKCFGCGASGDAIDFTAKLHGIGLPQAAAKVNDDFGLGFDMAKGDTLSTVSKYVIQKRRIDAFRKYERSLFVDLCNEYHRIQDVIRDQASGWQEALGRLSLTEHYVNQLIYLPEDKKIEWLSENRKDVEEYAGRLSYRNKQGDEH